MQQITEAAEYLKSKGITKPEIGIILGTGLGNLATHIKTEAEISYSDIPNFPVSTVESHAGKLIYGKIKGKQVLAMKGRFHFYEGYSMEQITLPVRVMKLLGIQFLLVSNAAGCLNPGWKKGELMLLDDHINLLPTNPLVGKNLNELGPRFPDMSRPYSSRLNSILEESAADLGIPLRKGVYAAVQGPMLETRAEYRFLRIIGADAVGMSTVPEIITARHMNIPSAAVSVLTDECDPDNLFAVSLEEILEVAGKAELLLSGLFIKLIEKLNY